MSDPRFDTSKPVLVTGATGYVAGWLIKRLLEEGFTVHAAVRDPARADRLAHLDRLAADLPGKLVYYQADLLEQGSYADAMAGCGTVFHAASPFIVDFEDPQQDLVDPALNGTRNVLNSVDATGSVERVVLTSSCAAIFGEAEDIPKAPGGILTEDVWNTSSSLDHNPYPYSKTVAEEAAWEIAEAQDRWRLVVVNPALVIGPALNDRPTSASFDYLRMMGDGTFRDGAPDFHVGMVDVRDVAEAHLRAGFVPEAKGRHIVYAEALSMGDLAEILRAEFGNDYKLPREGATPQPDILWRADNGKSRRDLGVRYRAVDQGVMEMFQQLADDAQLAAA